MVLSSVEELTGPHLSDCSEFYSESDLHHSLSVQTLVITNFGGTHYSVINRSSDQKTILGIESYDPETFVISTFDPPRPDTWYESDSTTSSMVRVKRVTRKKRSHFDVDDISIETIDLLVEEADAYCVPIKGEKHPNYRFNTREARHRNFRMRQRQRQQRAKRMIEPHGEQQTDEQTNDSLRKKMQEVILNTLPMDQSKSFEYMREIAGLRKEMTAIADHSTIAEWTGFMESVVLFAYNASKSTSLLDLFMAVVGYVKMEYKGPSVIAELYKLMDSFLEDTKEVRTQAEEAWDGKRVLDAWEMTKSHTVFASVSYLISAAMSLGVCATEKIEWSPMGFKLVCIEPMKEQMKAVDFLDACIRTFTWFHDTGARCIATKSLLPLLYSDQVVQEYNSEYAEITSRSEAVLAGNIDDLGAYEKRLDALLARSSEMKAARSTGPTAMWIQAHYSALVTIKQKVIAKRKGTDIRYAPIGFALTGGTSVGKSSLAKLTMLSSLAAQGFCDENGVVDQSRIITIDMFDRYDTSLTSDVLGALMDDVDNTKSEFAKENPHTARIIKFFNNVAAQAVKAELNQKGVVFIDFKTGVVTSNSRDLGVTKYSNCPESILRRFYHVSVKVKKKYQMRGSTMLNTNHPDILNSTELDFDVWDLDMYEVVTQSMNDEGASTSWKFVPMLDSKGQPCKNLNLEQYLQKVVELSRDHKRAQENLLRKSQLSRTTAFCKSCTMLPKFCRCEDIKPHGLVESLVFPAMTKAVSSYFADTLAPARVANSLLGFAPVKQRATDVLADELKNQMDVHLIPNVLAFVPSCIWESDVSQKLFGWWVHQHSVRKFPRILMGVIVALGFLAFSSFWRFCYTQSLVDFVALVSFLLTIPVVLALFRSSYLLRTVAVRNEYLERRDALPKYLATVRDSNLTRNTLVLAAVALGVRLLYVWNQNRVKDITAQMSPKDVDSQPGWFGFLADSLSFKMTSSVKGAHTGQFADIVGKHLGRADFEAPNGVVVNCNIVYPCKGIVWFPKHIFYPVNDMTGEPYKYVKVTVKCSDTKEAGGFRFVAELGVNTIMCDDLDMVATFVSRCPDVKDNFTKHLLSEYVTAGKTIGTLYVREKNGTLVQDTLNIRLSKVGHKFLSFQGGDYNSTLAKNGSCMGPVIAEGKRPAICGFHMGGDGYGLGIMMSITKDRAERLNRELLSLPGIRPLSQATDLPEKQYGLEILKSKEAHPNAMLAFEGFERSEVDVLGSTRLRAEAKSRVCESVISPHVSEHFGVYNNWGAPRLKPNWKAFNATLEHIVSPSDPFTPSLLERARQDWVKPIIKFARELNREQNVRPLTDKEMVLGVPGVRFLDAIPMDTSMGFPVFGPKTNHFEEVRDGEQLVDRVPSAEVKAEMARIMECWERGERAYPVTVATLKDEPTLITKEKVRVFQAVAVAFGLYIRKYYLPIARVLSLNPLLSESAVGVNAFGPQWEELMDYSEKYMGLLKRVLAWDYSKYDVRMGSDVIYAVLMCFIDIASVCNYSQHDLRIMNAMVADMMHPLMDYNGTMIMAYNLNTSGNNITVNINGTAGSLYPRMFFFSVYPELENFRDYVAQITYGDDSKSSARELVREKFNFTGYQQFLKQYGMKITLPDKGDDVRDDLGHNEADFLKRMSNYIPEIDRKIGKLAEASIFKSLHSNLKSTSATPREVAVSCIEGAMHEWFAHGRKIYEARQAKMKLVCRDARLPVPAVDLTFDERVEQWKEKYLSPLDTNGPKA